MTTVRTSQQPSTNGNTTNAAAAAPAAPSNRIPPPPLLPINNLHPQQQQPQQHTNTSTTNNAPFPWILRVRCPRNASSSSSSSWNNLTTIRINITPDMTVETLSKCIGQIISTSSSSGGGGSHVDIDHVAGLFGMHDGIFYSLQHILGNVDEIESNGIQYCTVRPPPPPPPPPHEWTVWEYIALLLTVVAVIARYGEYVRDLSIKAIVEAYYIMFDLPFREVYRYGPKFVGWEGMDLPEICTRITFYGDRSFWARNLEECEDIYGSKEEAFIRVVRPVVYITICIILFMAAQHLVSSYAEQKRDRTDRAVIDTYHAVQTLIRLSNRSQRR